MLTRSRLGLLRINFFFQVYKRVMSLGHCQNLVGFHLISCGHIDGI